MNNIATDSITPEDPTVKNGAIANLESSLYPSPSETDSSPTLLPRSAWNSQITYLRVLFRAKKALDRIEQEVGISRS